MLEKIAGIANKVNNIIPHTSHWVKYSPKHIQIYWSTDYINGGGMRGRAALFVIKLTNTHPSNIKYQVKHSLLIATAAVAASHYWNLDLEMRAKMLLHIPD